MAHHDHMAVLFDADVPVHYGFINLLGADEEDQADLMDTRAGQVNGLLGAAAPGQLSLVTGLHTGRVPLVVRWHDTEPALGDEWEDVVEASFEPPQADLLVTSFQDSFELRLPAMRSLRARYCASQMDAARDADTVTGNEPTIDRYLLELWPADPAPDTVVRQTSEVAAYWHEQAQATPGGEDQAIVAQDYAIVSSEEYEASMEAWRWSASGLREDFDSWAPAKQRGAARWLARRSLEKAGLAQFLPALDALDRGEPLPQPFTSEEDVFGLLPPGDSYRQGHAVAAVFSAAELDASAGLSMAFHHAKAPSTTTAKRWSLSCANGTSPTWSRAFGAADDRA
jgi:hypothetical protein